MGAIKKGTALKYAGESRTIIINEGFFYDRKRRTVKKVNSIETHWYSMGYHALSNFNYFSTLIKKQLSTTAEIYA